MSNTVHFNDARSSYNKNLKQATAGLTALQRENRELKEHLQDAVSLATKFKSVMGLIDQEELARVGVKATGVRFNVKEFDMTPTNGEQGR